MISLDPRVQNVLAEYHRRYDDELPVMRRAVAEGTVAQIPVG